MIVGVDVNVEVDVIVIGLVDFTQPIDATIRLTVMKNESPRLDYENLDVYRAAIEFLALALSWTRRLRGKPELKSQLKRAAMSIPLNIAEGTGKNSPGECARFLAIARGSAAECSAIVDVCQICEVISEQEALKGKQLLVRIVSMLTKMCR